MPEAVKVIKRYQNRKLYDTQSSRYVTLDDIADMIREGQSVRIVDNRTKKDLTNVTLTQIVFEQEKKQKSILPQGLLTKFIQSGGESFQEFFDKRIAPSLVGLSSARAEFEKYIEKLTAAGQIPRDEGLRIVKDFLSSGQKGIDEVQKRIEQRAKNVVAKLKTLSQLQQDVEELEAKVAQIEHRLAKERKTSAKAAGRKAVAKKASPKKAKKPKAAKPAKKTKTKAKAKAKAKTKTQKTLRTFKPVKKPAKAKTLPVSSKKARPKSKSAKKKPVVKKLKR